MNFDGLGFLSSFFWQVGLLTCWVPRPEWYISHGVSFAKVCWLLELLVSYCGSFFAPPSISRRLCQVLASCISQTHSVAIFLPNSIHAELFTHQHLSLMVGAFYFVHYWILEHPMLGVWTECLPNSYLLDTWIRLFFFYFIGTTVSGTGVQSLTV